MMNNVNLKIFDDLLRTYNFDHTDIDYVGKYNNFYYIGIRDTKTMFKINNDCTTIEQTSNEIYSLKPEEDGLSIGEKSDVLFYDF